MRRRTYQTPNEYAAMLAGALGEAAPSARRIAQDFAVLRYTGVAPSEEDDDGEMEEAWHSIPGAS